MLAFLSPIQKFAVYIPVTRKYAVRPKIIQIKNLKAVHMTLCIIHFQVVWIIHYTFYIVHSIYYTLYIMHFQILWNLSSLICSFLAVFLSLSNTVLDIIDRIANQTVQLCHSTTLDFPRIFTQNILGSGIVRVLLKGNLLSYQKIA